MFEYFSRNDKSLFAKSYFVNQWPESVRNLLIMPLIIFLLTTILSGCFSPDYDKSVVRVVSAGVGSGTGFVVATGGYIVTNHHVIDKARSIKVYLDQQKDISYVATVLWKSSEFDLAILRAPDLKAPYLPINDGLVRKEDDVISIGFPGASDAVDVKREASHISTLTSGKVSRVFNADPHGNGTKIKVVQHTAFINKGNSGGPLINVCGEVVAVNTWIAASKLTKERGGTSVDVKHGTFFSSHAEEISNILKIRKVPASITSSRCNPEMQSIYLVAGLAMTGFMAFAALFFSLRNVPAMQRRAPNLSRIVGGNVAAPQHAAVQGSVAATVLDDDNDFYLIPKGGAERGTEMRISSQMARTQGIVIGRRPSIGGITVDDDAASREHVRITCSGKKPYIFYAEDLGSKNGTKINDRPVAHGTPPTAIRSGDKLRFGSKAYEFLSQQEFYNSRRGSSPVGEQWVLTGRDPDSGHTIAIAFDDNHFQKSGNQIIIGRDGDVCDFVIANPTISNRGHAKISRVGHDLYISDMGATNGVKVGGIKLDKGGNPVKLTSGSMIQLGAITLRVEKNV